jgi:2-oxoglutarate ferredoxin oxidoreductase subunit alpha
MEPVKPGFRAVERTRPDWVLEGAAGREPRVLKSLDLRPEDLERHNIALQAIYAEITAKEQRWAGESLDGAEVVLVAYGTAARIARTAVERAREAGLQAGLFRPITLWPFPAEALRRAARDARAVLAVEMSAGQLVEDVRLAIEGAVPVFHHGRMGGMVPTPDEVVDAMRRAWATSEGGVS